MELIKKFIEAVDGWLDASQKTKTAADVFMRLGGEYLDAYQSSLGVALDQAAAVAQLGKRLAADLAGSNPDRAGVLLVANLAADNANRKGPKPEAAARVLDDWPRIKASLQAVALQSDDPDGDPVENALRDQALTLYRRLAKTKQFVAYSSLAELDCWRCPPPDDSTVLRGLRKLQSELNKLDAAPSLTIEAEHHRVRLVR